MDYRKDIDGLRAIAVTSVVAYHAAEHWVPGGFVGVDVFFVISGYLITRLILRDAHGGSFSLTQFYVRRFRRILPALITCAAITTAIAVLVLTPRELRAFGPTLSGTFAFVSNVVFWLRADYFQDSSDQMPLLHTWSLAVEEQFYLLWPFAVVLFARTRLLKPMLVGTALATFIFSVLALTLDPQAAFYLLPSRAWELLVGAAVAATARKFEPGRLVRAGLALAGLGLLCTSIVVLNSASSFPGWNAVSPCIGAAMLIVAGEGLGNPVSERILGSRPFVLVGLISYSLYLWHWPLLSLARITQHGSLDTLQTGIALAVVAIASIASWRFVELPFRKATPSHPRVPLLRFAAISLLFVGAGYVIPSIVATLSPVDAGLAQIEAAARDTGPRAGPCLRTQGQSGPLPGPSCVVGSESARTLVIWGDSHASALAPGLEEYARKNGLASYQLTMIACPPLVDVEVRERHRSYTGCNAFNRMAIEHVESDPAVDTVVLSARWSLYTGGKSFGPDDQSQSMQVVASQGASGEVDELVQGLTAGLERTIARLRRARRRVVVIGSIPPIGINVPNCLVRNRMRWSSVSSCDRDGPQTLSELARADDAIATVVGRAAGVCSVFPAVDLCASGRCVSRIDDTILYADDDHLTARGAAAVVQRIRMEDCEH